MKVNPKTEVLYPNLRTASLFGIVREHGFINLQVCQKRAYDRASRAWVEKLEWLLQISLLQTDHNPDIMLLAARSLTFLADVLPACCGTIVRHGAVPALCERLLNIEYIDLAEQSLQVQPRALHASSLRRSGPWQLVSIV